MPGEPAAGLDDVLRPLVAAPERAGVFTDFDGTLADIVVDPGAAHPVAGAVEVLERLATRCGRVAVVSGRPVAFLTPWFGPGIALAGLYGLERTAGGVPVEQPGVERWRPVVTDVVNRAARALPPGVLVESKGLSLTLHVREHPELAGVAASWATTEAAATGLEVRPAKQSVELHPPLPVDKGTTVTELAAGLDAVCFIGDDVGDLPAYDALDRLAAAGVHTVRVGVRSAEESPELTARADLHVAGPAGAVALLAQLAAALG